MQVKMINNRPVKIWTDNVEESAMSQIENLTTLPFLFHHLAIMPDVHAGMGMPIGGVLACVDAVIPNAVGVDIGCGMCAVKTNWRVSDIPAEVLRKQIMRGIRKRIPLGMDHHKEAQNEKYLPQGHDIDALESMCTAGNFPNGRNQVCLGFIAGAVQPDEKLSFRCQIIGSQGVQRHTKCIGTVKGEQYYGRRHKSRSCLRRKYKGKQAFIRRISRK